MSSIPKHFPLENFSFARGKVLGGGRELTEPQGGVFRHFFATFGSVSKHPQLKYM